jgi:hypothetical protein
MSEGAAFRRINAARLVRRFPCLLPRIESGEVCLSTLVLVRDHLTGQNVETLIEEVAGKTQREVEALLARRAPKPEVRDMIAPIPGPTTQLVVGEAELVVERRPAERAVAPLSEDRFKVQLTASTELRDKLERARDLMRHRNPDGNLAFVVEQALDVLLEKLERQRLAKAKRPPRATPRREAASQVSRAVRREVFARDGEQCTFVSESGERCPARGFLELDHIESRALGGDDGAGNLRVLCRFHNRLHAEDVFGKGYVAERIDFRQRKSRREASDSAGRKRVAGPLDAALHGLGDMGFRKTDAQRALATIAARFGDRTAAMTVDKVLLEALSILT